MNPHPMKKIISFSTIMMLLAIVACKPNYQEAQAEEQVSGPKVTSVKTEQVVLSKEVLPVNGVGMLSSSQETKHSF